MWRLSGVTGSDLKQRDRRDHEPAHCEARWSVDRRLLLAAASVVAVALPIAVGILQSPLLRAQSPSLVEPRPRSRWRRSSRTNPGRPGGIVRTSDRSSQLFVVNDTLFDVIRNAYGMQDNQILGGPDWIRATNERFDITAKAPDGTKPDQLLLMVHRLLADRFRLRLHKETREVPMFALVVARADRKLGPQMEPAAFDCTALRAAFGAR